MWICAAPSHGVEQSCISRPRTPPSMSFEGEHIWWISNVSFHVSNHLIFGGQNDSAIINDIINGIAGAYINIHIIHTYQYNIYICRITKYIYIYIRIIMKYIYIYIHTYIPLHYIALHCIALHCIALHCIALHCITLHYIHTYLLHVYIYIIISWNMYVYIYIYIYMYIPSYPHVWRLNPHESPRRGKFPAMEVVTRAQAHAKAITWLGPCWVRWVSNLPGWINGMWWNGIGL